MLLASHNMGEVERLCNKIIMMKQAQSLMKVHVAS